MTHMRSSQWLLFGTLLYCLSLQACSSIGHVDELWLLKQYGDETAVLDDDVDWSEEQFQIIWQDAQQGKLAEGLAKETIRQRYGDPVYIQDPAEFHSAAVLWMYRRPVHFFESDRVLLYFSSEGRLVSHTLENHQPKSE